MGNGRILAEAWLRHAPGMPVERVIDLGGGDGTFLLRLALRLKHHWPSVALTLVDSNQLPAPEVLDGAAKNGFHLDYFQQDAVEFLQGENCNGSSAIISNLFLHHFEGRDLRTLLEAISRKTGLFLACEPRRSPVAAFGTCLLWLLACNQVTRHDAKASVRAGFRDHELTAHWPCNGWLLIERAAGPFSHVFVARRDEHKSA
jgi:hypothetical protein